MTTTEQLNEINSAISAILGGAQEYRIHGRLVRKAELSALLKERIRLEAALASQDGRDVAVAFLGER